MLSLSLRGWVNYTSANMTTIITGTLVIPSHNAATLSQIDFLKSSLTDTVTPSSAKRASSSSDMPHLSYVLHYHILIKYAIIPLEFMTVYELDNFIFWAYSIRRYFFSSSQSTVINLIFYWQLITICCWSRDSICEPLPLIIKSNYKHTNFLLKRLPNLSFVLMMIS